MNKDKYIKIKWQNGIIPENGVNGVQAIDVLETIKNHLLELDKKHPSAYNRLTIGSINDAINCQNMRTKDRDERGVEGKDEK